MNIFLPYVNNIKKSIESLDDKRLIKQILEVYQLLQIYKVQSKDELLTGKGYQNHPIYKHYSQYPDFMYLYGHYCCQEYLYRFSTHHKYEEYFDYKINSSERVKNYNYIPFYMEGSKNSPNNIRVTDLDSVEYLFQKKLINKWVNSKYTVKWTNRDVPEFLTQYFKNK